MAGGKESVRGWIRAGWLLKISRDRRYRNRERDIRGIRDTAASYGKSRGFE